MESRARKLSKSCPVYNGCITEFKFLWTLETSYLNAFADTMIVICSVSVTGEVFISIL